MVNYSKLVSMDLITRNIERGHLELVTDSEFLYTLYYILYTEDVKGMWILLVIILKIMFSIKTYYF